MNISDLEFTEVSLQATIPKRSIFIIWPFRDRIPRRWMCRSHSFELGPASKVLFGSCLGDVGSGS